MSAIRSIALIIAIFVIAVLLGLLIHPAVSLLFIVLAKVVERLWSAGAPAFRESYQQTMAHEKSKRKLRHILTDDGERLDVVFDDSAAENLVSKPHE